MQKAGWKDAEGKTLGQKMDLGGMPDLPKGFGNVGKNVPAKGEKVVKEAPKSGIIDGKDINIDKMDDELTPCLKDAKTGEIVKTEHKLVSSLAEIKKISREYKWEFDWVLEWSRREKRSEIYKLTIKDDKQTQ